VIIEGVGKKRGRRGAGSTSESSILSVFEGAVITEPT
jgi:hypothetical protein